jgi:hypothetical protein
MDARTLAAINSACSPEQEEDVREAATRLVTERVADNVRAPGAGRREGRETRNNMPARNGACGRVPWLRCCGSLECM